MTLVAQMPATSEQKPIARITKFYSRPDTRDFFVLALRGKLYKLSDGKKEVYFDIAEHVPNFINAPGHATGFVSHSEARRVGREYGSQVRLLVSQYTIKKK